METQENKKEKNKYPILSTFSLSWISWVSLFINIVTLFYALIWHIYKNVSAEDSFELNTDEIDSP